jgi:hypothetical protein
MPDQPLPASIDAMRHTLAMARALVQGGRHVDLAGLEEEAAGICAALQAAPPDDARPLRPAMQALLAELDALAFTMPEP